MSVRQPGQEISERFQFCECVTRNLLSLDDGFRDHVCGSYLSNCLTITRSRRRFEPSLDEQAIPLYRAPSAQGLHARRRKQFESFLSAATQIGKKSFHIEGAAAWDLQYVEIDMPMANLLDYAKTKPFIEFQHPPLIVVKTETLRLGGEGQKIYEQLDVGADLHPLIHDQRC